MKRLLYIFLSLSCVLLHTLYTREMTVSVVIPCVPQHVPHLFNLLSHYARQTEVPQEVIISLSRIGSVPQDLINKLTDTKWPFKLVLIRNTQRTSAGKNRNLGAQAAQSDIIMFQDADDIPHPQRVEIVKYFFSKYDIYHLMHSFIIPEVMTNNGEIPKEFTFYEKQEISFKNHVAYETTLSFPFTNGEPCMLRELASKMQWPDQYDIGEDSAYTRAIYGRFPNNIMLIKVPLILYRKKLSSGWL